MAHFEACANILLLTTAREDQPPQVSQGSQGSQEPHRHSRDQLHSIIYLASITLIRRTMGNCFGKLSSANNFQGEGRTVGSNPAQIPAANRSSKPASAPLPSNVNQEAVSRPPNDGSITAAGQAAQVGHPG